jgi:DNA helicase IV
LSHPELAAEQRYVDAAYARLDAMRDAARRVAEGFADMGAGGTHQARLERDVAEDVTRRRLAALDIGDAPLCFGRVDLVADGTPSSNGHGDQDAVYYVGRLSVTDEEQVPLVVDWRAPVAEPFYRATAIEPMGVARRRHFLTKPGRGRELVGLDDEVFDRDAVEASGMTVIGEGALLVALERSRTGRMSDIVATIQAEQDEAIRAGLPGVLVVAGGAGTGKTAVALHRAAYLLYTHRRQLGSQGVLLVGPSTIFLRYIDQVLPSLGEDDVQLATPAGLKPTYRVTTVDESSTARVKGDARMATVIASALRDREHPLPQDLVVMVDGNRLRVRRGATERIVERARRQRGTHNEKRPRVVRALVDQLVEQYRRAFGPAAPDDPEWTQELHSRLRRLPEVRAALERMWPVLTGGELIHDLFSFPALIRSAADGVLTREEQAGLHRPRSENVRAVPWTDADLALIDEADALLGSPEAARPRRKARRRAVDDAAQRVVAELGVGGFITAAEVARRYAGNDGQSAPADDDPRTFGHVLVDEAQDLSPMQWRMLARRCPTGSMTVVGDFGQSSRPGAAASWDEVLGILPQRAPSKVVTLTVNYRTPAEVMDVAHHVLAAGAPGVEPTRAVRTTGEHPEFRRVDHGALVAAAAEGARRVAGEGTVAVVAPLDLHDEIVDALGDLDVVADSVEALDAEIAVLTPMDVKGLEFDHVVVVEPAQLVSADAAGLRMLYVTLTRATRRLVVVHAEPLPDALAEAAQPSAAAAAS